MQVALLLISPLSLSPPPCLSVPSPFVATEAPSDTLHRAWQDARSSSSSLSSWRGWWRCLCNRWTLPSSARPVRRGSIDGRWDRGAGLEKCIVYTHIYFPLACEVILFVTRAASCYFVSCPKLPLFLIHLFALILFPHSVFYIHLLPHAYI